MKQLKVYQMNDCDWWADYSIKNAKKNYLKFTGIPNDDDYYDDDMPVELTEEEMNHLMFKPDPIEEPNVDERTFQEELDKMIEEGNTKPFFFASTEY